jgi:hypothetical protein
MNPSFPDPKAILRATLALLVIWATGCSNPDFGTGPNPSETELNTTQTTAIRHGLSGQGSFGIAISPPALAKRAGPQGSSKTEKKIKAKKGGRLTLVNSQTFATFSIPKRALEKNTKISMELIGEGASVLVKFGPSGLQFLKECTLSLTFPSDSVDLSEIGGYYIPEGGEAIPIGHEVRQYGNRIVVRMAITHFSVFSPGDGEDDGPPPEGEP